MPSKKTNTDSNPGREPTAQLLSWELSVSRPFCSGALGSPWPYSCHIHPHAALPRIETGIDLVSTHPPWGSGPGLSSYPWPHLPLPPPGLREEPWAQSCPCHQLAYGRLAGVGHDYTHTDSGHGSSTVLQDVDTAFLVKADLETNLEALEHEIEFLKALFEEVLSVTRSSG